MESSHREFSFGDLLGKGGFGEVYLAEMNTTGGLARKVAIKLLHAGLDAEASQAVERLRDEGRMLAVLAHPSVLGIVDVITLEQRVALVTEYVDGEDLDGCFDAHIPPRALVQVVGEVASALSAAWTELQLVHRDIKPANVRVGRHGQVKLLDFGIASTDQLTRAAKTASGMILGTMPYMAPERFMEEGVQPAGDVFALGVTLLQGLTRRSFYGRKPPISVIVGLAADPDRYRDHVDKHLRRLSEELPDEVGDLVRACLAHDPEDRPTALELSERCRELVGTLEGPILASWCGARTWPEPSKSVGSWTGRVITEGFTIQTRAVDMPKAPAPVSEPRSGPGKWVLAGGGVVALIAAMTLVVVVVGGLGAMAVYSNTASEPTAASASPEDAEPEVVDEAEPSEETESTMEAAPAERTDASQLSSEPDPSEPDPSEPDPSEPEPSEPSEPVATPVPAAPAAVESFEGVVLANGASVQLRAGDQTHLPGLVPHGTYEIWADFGDGWEPAGEVAVGAEDVQLNCNPLLRRCEAQ